MNIRIVSFFRFDIENSKFNKRVKSLIGISFLVQFVTILVVCAY